MAAYLYIVAFFTLFAITTIVNCEIEADAGTFKERIGLLREIVQEQLRETNEWVKRVEQLQVLIEDVKKDKEEGMECFKLIDINKPFHLVIA